ncbi:MAG: helix-turn-helix transcriptional regulator [Synergistaceae bacterium]|nr:helix-turn-helix transcriptional regulator [Synergistaceae bacterium]MBQ9595505.1 helix-turn-helix transcriptional regulator [Synergistaceae bacterium]MBR0203943.1 helix-turn-helix transcriptional regulator [Synergistaceae bacterium]
MTVSANIRQLRKKAGLTQIELAEKIGVSIATLRRWEAGETSPTGTKITEIADLLGVLPDEIVKDDNKTVISRSDIKHSNSANSVCMLVYEGEGTRIELPPTEKGYELFNRLIDTMINKRNPQAPNQSSPEDL